MHGSVFSMSHGYLKHTMRQQPKGTEKWYNTKEFGDFNAFTNLGNRYRSGDFNAPRNSIFSYYVFETETFKVIFKDSGTEVIFFVSISSSSIVRLTNDIHDHVLCYCQHHLFKGVVFWSYLLRTGREPHFVDKIPYRKKGMMMPWIIIIAQKFFCNVCCNSFWKWTTFCCPR